MRSGTNSLPSSSSGLVDGTIESAATSYTSTLWIEVMLVKDLNDGESRPKDLAAVLARIEPIETHISLLLPPAEAWVRGLFPCFPSVVSISKIFDNLGASTRGVRSRFCHGRFGREPRVLRWNADSRLVISDRKEGEGGDGLT